MLFKHIKTPDIYVILALGTNEATLEPVVIYENVETGAVWTRPASEFFDGRFGGGDRETVAEDFGGIAMKLIALNSSVSVNPEQVESVEVIRDHHQDFVRVAMSTGAVHLVKTDYRANVWETQKRLITLIEGEE